MKNFIDYSYSELLDKYESDQRNFQPWYKPLDRDASLQILWKKILEEKAGAALHPSSFVSPDAAIFTGKLTLGEGSWIASGAIVRGYVSFGSNCSVNPYAHIAGVVMIGNDVRVAGSVSIYGFDHGYSDLDIPVWKQPTTQKGIRIGDDVWIGANSVILDGSLIGSHSIVGAGSVVKGVFPPFSIIAGNPAVYIKSRSVC